jgi:hypothetical protein
MGDGHVSVGVYGSYAALESIVSRYRQRAAHIYFPYPARLDVAGADARVDDMHGLMVIEFDREQFAVVASEVKALAARSDATAGAPASGIKMGQ